MSGFSWWTDFGWTMIHFSWVATLIGLLALLIRPSLRGLAPELRYGFSLAVFAAVAVSPVFIFLVLTAGGGGVGAEAKARAHIVAGSGAAPASQSMDSGVVILDPVVPVDSALVVKADVERLVAVLPALWLVGACLAFLRLGTGAAGARRLRSSSRRVTDPALLALLNRLREGLGVTQRVALSVNDRVLSPLVVGSLRPLIVLPPSLVTGWTPEAVEMALIHELGHVLRRDNLVNLFQRVIEALFFFHPVVWLLSREVRCEREHCCDALVVSRTRKPRAYAATLLSLASPPRRLPPAATAMAEHDLVERVRRILEKETVMTNRTHRCAGIIGAVVCLGVLSLSVFGQWAEPAPAQAPRPPQEEPTPIFDPAAPFESWHARLLPPQEEGSCPRAKTGASCTNCHKVDPKTPSPHGLDPAYLALGACTNCHMATSLTTVSQFRHQEKKRAWGPEQATGAPDTPRAGDIKTAWASLTQDDQREWLDLSWKRPVRAQALQVYESYKPGAVDRVTVRTTSGRVYKLAVANEFKLDSREVRVLSIPLRLDGAVKSVRLHLNSPAVKGWNEIDAVGLIDSSGDSHWAAAAKASSTYASRTGGPDPVQVPDSSLRLPRAVDPRLLPDPVRAPQNPFAGNPSEADLRRRLAETRRRLEDALKRLEKLEKELGRRDGAKHRESFYEARQAAENGDFQRARLFYESALKSLEAEKKRSTFDDLKRQYEERQKRGGGLDSPHAPPLLPKPLTGKVIAIKQDQVSASFGSSDGVKRGLRFDVIRGNKYLGSLRVDRVEKDHCTGKLILKASGASVRVGDRVTNTLN